MKEELYYINELIEHNIDKIIGFILMSTSKLTFLRIEEGGGGGTMGYLEGAEILSLHHKPFI